MWETNLKLQSIIQSITIPWQRMFTQVGASGPQWGKKKWTKILSNLNEVHFN